MTASLPFLIMNVFLHSGSFLTKYKHAFNCATFCLKNKCFFSFYPPTTSPFLYFPLQQNSPKRCLYSLSPVFFSSLFHLSLLFVIIAFFLLAWGLVCCRFFSFLIKMKVYVIYLISCLM